VIEAAGPAANGLTSADIYFPEAQPFASDPENQRFVAPDAEAVQGAAR
jgi:branched-chain amino acid transport system substrate-binding protein